MGGDLDTVLHDPERLDALVRLRLLDSPAEEAFDRLTRLAARILDVPVCLVSLVDDHRQFFKSACGVPEPWASLRETPLSYSFCQHVVASGEPLIVEDAREHPLLCKNLAVKHLDVVAYLGIPLVTPDGHTIGSFCAVDTQGRVWTASEQEIMRELAASVMSEVRLGVANRAMEEEVQTRTAQLSASNLALREIEARYKSLVESSPQGVFVHRDFHILYANAAMARLWGYAHPDEFIGREVADFLVAPEYRAATRKRLAAVYARESVTPSQDWPGLHTDGSEIWFNSRGIPIDWLGQPAILSFCLDITERKRSEEHQRELIAELDHRVKNVLARVSAVVSFSRIGASSMDAFVETLDGRIQSLAYAHQLLSRNSWQAVSLAKLVDSQLAPYVAMERSVVEGPDVLLTADATQALAPVFHELVTNAAKYGALTDSNGLVSVSWRIIEPVFGGAGGRSAGGTGAGASASGEPHLEIEWLEAGGPVVEAPKSLGFGSRMIREITSFELKGKADLVFDPRGARCTLIVPLAKLVADP